MNGWILGFANFMKDVRAALETELTALLTSAAILDCPVLPGASDVPAPDRYVRVVATGAEPRGSASLVTVEYRIVAPIDGYPVIWSQETLAKVRLWCIACPSPMRRYNANGLRIFGSSPPRQYPDSRDRSRAEILQFKVGAITC